jgi:hypothetical protein
MGSTSTLPSNVVQNYTATVDRGLIWSNTTLADGTTFPSGNLVPDTVIEERCDDELVMTENPVEDGSTTSDHAYDLPQDLEVTYAWQVGAVSGRSIAFLDDTYTQLLNLKQAKIILTVATGKRAYYPMLIKGISVTNDRDTENILLARISLRELLLTTTQAGTVAPASQQSLPQKTMSTTNNGNVSALPAPNFNSAGS